jgi:hypothetical protein
MNRSRFFTILATFSFLSSASPATAQDAGANPADAAKDKEMPKKPPTPKIKKKKEPAEDPLHAK